MQVDVNNRKFQIFSYSNYIIFFHEYLLLNKTTKKQQQQNLIISQQLIKIIKHKLIFLSIDRKTIFCYRLSNKFKHLIYNVTLFFK